MVSLTRCSLTYDDFYFTRDPSWRQIRHPSNPAGSRSVVPSEVSRRKLPDRLAVATGGHNQTLVGVGQRGHTGAQTSTDETVCPLPVPREAPRIRPGFCWYVQAEVCLYMDHSTRV